jgi:hypothetical protein
MPARLRKLLMSLVILAAIPLSALSPSGNGAVLADGTCNNGTHWDTITQSCR